MKPVLGGGVDPRLVFAVEGDAAGALAIARLSGLVPDQVAAGAEAEAGSTDPGGGQQAATGELGHMVGCKGVGSELGAPN